MIECTSCSAVLTVTLLSILDILVQHRGNSQSVDLLLSYSHSDLSLVRFSARSLPIRLLLWHSL